MAIDDSSNHLEHAEYILVVKNVVAMLDPFWREDEAAPSDLELRAPAPGGDSPFQDMEHLVLVPVHFIGWLFAFSGDDFGDRGKRGAYVRKAWSSLGGSALELGGAKDFSSRLDAASAAGAAS